MAAAPTDHGPLGPGDAPARAGLKTLRIMFSAFMYGLVMIGGVAVLLAGGTEASEGALDAVTASLVSVGVAVASLGAIRVVEPDLDCSSATDLAASYRTRFFLRLALAEAGPLVGFVFVVVTGEFWPYLAALVPAAVGFARAAPTAANLRRDQEELDLRGCPHRLVDAFEGITA